LGRKLYLRVPPTDRERSGSALTEDDSTVVRIEPPSVSTLTETDAVPFSAEAVAEAVASPPFGRSVLTARVTVELLTVACSSTTFGPR
jgi:hypothetical protein